MKTCMIQSVVLNDMLEKYYVEYREQRVRELMNTSLESKTDCSEFNALEKAIELDAYESVFDLLIEKEKTEAEYNLDDVVAAGLINSLSLFRN